MEENKNEISHSTQENVLSNEQVVSNSNVVNNSNNRASLQNKPKKNTSFLSLLILGIVLICAGVGLKFFAFPEEDKKEKPSTDEEEVEYKPPVISSVGDEPSSEEILETAKKLYNIVDSAFLFSNDAVGCSAKDASEALTIDNKKYGRIDYQPILDSTSEEFETELRTTLGIVKQNDNYYIPCQGKVLANLTDVVFILKEESADEVSYRINVKRCNCNGGARNCKDISDEIRGSMKMKKVNDKWILDTLLPLQQSNCVG